MPPDVIAPRALARMTDGQRQGFALACAAFARWGQATAAAPTLPGTPPGEARAMRDFGRRLLAMASALSRAADRGLNPGAAPRRRLPPADFTGRSRAAHPAPPADAAPAPPRNSPAARRPAGQPKG